MQWQLSTEHQAFDAPSCPAGRRLGRLERLIEASPQLTEQSLLPQLTALAAQQSDAAAAAAAEAAAKEGEALRSDVNSALAAALAGAREAGSDGAAGKGAEAGSGSGAVLAAVAALQEAMAGVQVRWDCA